MSEKITFFSPNLNGGGAERVISILTSSIAMDCLDVDLILSKSEGPYLNDLNKSVNIVDFEKESVSLCFYKLFKYLLKEKPKVIFTSHFHTSIISIWATKLSRVKTKVIIRQPNMLKPKHYKMSIKAKLVNNIFLLSARLSDQVIVTSENMADEFVKLSKIDKNKINVIYNPVPISYIKNKADEPVVNKYFLTDDIPKIIAVGRLEKAKDFSTLIKAFKLVNNKIRSQLLILGEGSARPELENLINQLDISEFVAMPGFASNPYQYMKLADVFVSTSLWEGFPNSMVEAMACSLHIVSTDSAGGASEILGNGKWGEIVPIGDVELIAKAILHKINQGKLVSPCSRVNDFSKDVIVAKYKEHLTIERGLA